MPELPEVETVKRGLAPHLEQHTVHNVVVRQPRLRWPIDPQLPQKLSGLTLQHITRCAKYLLFDFGHGVLLIHLGMSGSLRLVDPETPVAKHDHVDFDFGDQLLRYHDPRRFGAIVWQPGPAEVHPLLQQLGPEPLSPDFTAEALQNALSSRRSAIKLCLMDNHVVVGVGNIYANEALFLAGIHPQRPANTLTLAECRHLITTVQHVLQRAIAAGGSTLRDFVDAVGKPGYFQQNYTVYGRTGLPCHHCHAPIEMVRLGQRGTFFCPMCQH